MEELRAIPDQKYKESRNTGWCLEFYQPEIYMVTQALQQGAVSQEAWQNLAVASAGLSEPYNQVTSYISSSVTTSTQQQQWPKTKQTCFFCLNAKAVRKFRKEKAEFFLLHCP